MRKRILAIVLLSICLVLAGCGHEHVWQAATCVSPKICPECGETEGDALGHKWIEATCVDPKICEICLNTMGQPLGHIWNEATCTEAKTCQSCNAVDGQALGHTWEAATCVLPEICSVCAETQGVPLGHTFGNWTLVTASTCTTPGIESGSCTVCGEYTERNTELAEHTPGDWEIKTQATADREGTKVKKCTECGEELESQNFTMTKEELKKFYEKECKKISYDKLSRNPQDYVGEYVKFSGKVVQVCSEAKSALYYSTYRVATSGSKNVVYILVDNYGSGSRILEDDYITFYGKFDGLYTYETVMGSSLTIPKIIVEFIG